MTTTGTRTRPPLAAVVPGLAAVVTVLLIAFAWPATRSGLERVPLGVAGPGAEQVERSLPAGTFTPRRYADAAAARAAIEDREVYGAVVTGPTGPRVLTASAASAPVAQALVGLAGGIGAPVEDVVPAPAADPRGAGLAAGALPLAIAGILGAALLQQLVAGRWARVGAAVGYSVLAGAALAAVLQFWIGAVDGPYAAVAGVLALGLAAVTVALLGLQAVLGRAGLAIGAVLTMLLGNPLSGAASAPEMLPAGWSELGRVLAPGAEVTLLRSVAFFDGAGGTFAALVLAGWLAAGLALVALARPAPTPA